MSIAIVLFKVAPDRTFVDISAISVVRRKSVALVALANKTTVRVHTVSVVAQFGKHNTFVVDSRYTKITILIWS